MSLVRYEIAAMIAISESWVNPEKDRALLESHRLTAGLVPILAREHNALLRTRMSRLEMDDKQKELAEKAAVLDTAHDEAYRTLHGMLTSLAMMSGDERRARLDEIRETLMPEGIRDPQLTFLAESGTVEMATSMLSREMEALMRGIEVDGRSLMQLFNEWVDAGSKLGNVERQRTQLAEMKGGEGWLTGRDIQNGRYRWMRAVNALLALLELDSDISEQTKTRILQPLRDAEKAYSHLHHGADDSDARPEGSIFAAG